MLADMRLALRMLTKAPAFATVAVLALALGIGASTTTFSAINALLLKPWPYIKDQSRVVFVSESFPKVGKGPNGVAYPDYVDFKREATKTIEGLGISYPATMILSDGEKPDRYLGAFVSADAFTILGVQPILGRNFRPDEDQPNAEPVAMLGYETWKTHFASDPGVVGRVVTVNGKRATIAGVMPKGWRFPETSDLWMPLKTTEKDDPRGNFNFDCFARMKPGVTIEQVRAELDAIAARIAADHPQSNAGCTAYVRNFREETVDNARTLTVLLMGAVLFVHLIACANVANLLLARAASRNREIAVRIALGAGRGTIVRQLLAESLVLGIIGSAVGLLFSFWGIDLMTSSIPVELPYWLHFDLDWRVFTFAITLGVGSAVLFGLFPALQASRPELMEAIKEGPRGSSGGRKGQRVRSALVVAEVALALVLLVGAGLMLRSFIKLQNTDIGIDPADVLTFRTGIPPSQFKQEDADRFFKQLMPKVAEIPGVEASGATSALPAMGNVGNNAVRLEGEPAIEEAQKSRQAHVITITPGFLQAARIPLLGGRDFTAGDNENSQRVVLIDERGARQWFPNLDPVGHQLEVVLKLGQEPRWATIVGVLRNVEYERLAQTRSRPCVYVPQYQQPEGFMSVMLRTKGDPNRFMKAAREAVMSVNKDIPIYKVQTMKRVVAESFWEQRFFGSLFTVFAALALFLAAIGLYGVMAYSVRQRTQEIGVRMALGAQTSDVLQLVTGQGMRLIAIGVGIGVVAAFFLTKLLEGNLAGVSVHDPWSFGIVAVVLSVVGLVASYLPARSATRLNPVEALRYE
jgi:putative ABC transport system permease protein